MNQSKRKIAFLPDEGARGGATTSRAPAANKSTYGTTVGRFSRLTLVTPFPKEPEGIDFDEGLNHLAEDEAKMDEPTLLGYGNRTDEHLENSAGHEDTTYARLVNSGCPACARATILLVIAPLMIAVLVASKLSIISFGEVYRDIANSNLTEEAMDDRYCQAKFAAFWTMLGPIVLQFLMVLFQYARARRYDIPYVATAKDLYREKVKNQYKERQKQCLRVSARGIGQDTSDTESSSHSVTEFGERHISNIGHTPHSPSDRSSTVSEFDEEMDLPDSRPSSRANSQNSVGGSSVEGTPKGLRRKTYTSTCYKLFGLFVGIFLDAALSAIGNMYLLFIIISSQHWVWTSSQMLTIPVMWNFFGFARRACGSDVGKDSVLKMKMRMMGDLWATVSQVALMVGLASAAPSESLLTVKGLAIPFTLFGGINLLRTRLSADRSALGAPNIFNDEPAKRFKYAAMRLFLEAVFIGAFGTFHWQGQSGVTGWASHCSDHSYMFLARYQDVLSNRYFYITIVHVTSSFAAILFAKLACSMRMSLMGLAFPLTVFWPVFLVCALYLPETFPDPFKWKATTIQDQELFILIAVGYLGHCWTTRHLWYEQAKSLSSERSVWYTPFFNTVVLDYALVLGRGAKAPRWRASEKATSSHERAPSLSSRRMGHDVEGLLHPEGHAVNDEQSVGRANSITSTSSSPNVLDETHHLIIKMSQDLEARAPTLTAKRRQQHIVLAACMWHENPKEMTQWVCSLANVVTSVIETAKRFFISPTGVYTRDTYEAHIVVDSAFERPRDFSKDDEDAEIEKDSDFRRPNRYAECLLKLIEEEIGSAIPFEKIGESLYANQLVTEYGVVLKVNLVPPDVLEEIQNIVRKDYCNYQGISEHKDLSNDSILQKLLEHFNVDFVLYIHLKDPILANPGKRANQILYMNFLLGELEKRKREHHFQRRMKFVPSMRNTLLLTTDGDTSFEFKDVDALVDSLIRDDEVAGACGRIRPLGAGLMVWFQQFEYAAGHWFQKTSEHVLGTVQCCPGCFSIWRVSRLNEILYDYSQSSESGQEYLRRDQGEDRWMCTLLIQHGWKMSYCAAAVAYTFAPENFDMFFDQRRRWLSSTMANMYDLIRVGGRVAKKHGRSGLPFLYRLYIIVMFCLSLLTPATIILLVAGGIELASGVGSGLGFFSSLFLPTTYVLLILWQEYRKTHASPFARCCRALYTSTSEGTPLLELSKEEYKKEMAKKFRRQQLSLAYLLTICYGFLLIVVLIGLLRNMFINFFFAENLFFLFLVGLFMATMAMHPRDMSTMHYGMVYFLCIPMAYLILYIYALSNMNVMSWGTRTGIAKPNENGACENWILEDPVATDASLRRRKQLPRGNTTASILSKSLLRYFEIPITLEGKKKFYHIATELRELAVMNRQVFQDHSQQGSLGAVGLDSANTAFCGVILPGEVRLTTVAQWMTYWRYVEETVQVRIYADTYRPLLLSVAYHRSATLCSLRSYGNNIRDYVIQESVPMEYRNSGRKDYRKDLGTGIPSTVNAEERREVIQEELDSARGFVGRIFLLINLFFPVFIVAMSLSTELFVFNSNIAGVAFLGFCGFVLSVQYLCMIVHRWETFMILVSFPFAIERSFQRTIIKACRSLVKKEVEEDPVQQPVTGSANHTTGLRPVEAEDEEELEFKDMERRR